LPGVDSIAQLLSSLGEQIKLAQQKLEELSQILGKLSVPPGPKIPTNLDALTEREKEIFNLLCEGIQPKKIATQLGISVKTVFLQP
jgi:DNA-binding NarL/FixJ family response regulator